MRTAATIFLLVLVVSTQTPVGQLFKLPLLIEHFIKHQKKEGLSLIDFLAEHYTSNHSDADRPEDEQLPFKNISFNAVGYAIIPTSIKTNTVVTSSEDKKINIPETYTPQQHLVRIFHPPKA